MRESIASFHINSVTKKSSPIFCVINIHRHKWMRFHNKFGKTEIGMLIPENETLFKEEWRGDGE